MRIIVIEDNELCKNELLQCLEQEESDIEIVGSASNGAEGLALTEKLIRDNLTPDVIFTDVRMPEMDGFEMIEALQRRGISCKIVVTSSCPEFLYAKRAMELGAVDFLVKPLKVYEVRGKAEKRAGKREKVETHSESGIHFSECDGREDQR